MTSGDGSLAAARANSGIGNPPTAAGLAADSLCNVNADGKGKGGGQNDGNANGQGNGNDSIDDGAGGGWTVQLNSGNVESDDGSTKTLSGDAAGTITLEDGTEIAFQNIESINY